MRTGLTAVGRWLPDPAVEEAGLRLAERLGYQGILDLDFRRDESGCFRLVDFNPRPGAQFRLFTDSSGLDVVQAMYLDLTGQQVPQPSGGPGRVFVAENYALLARIRGGSMPRRPAAVPADPAGSAGASASSAPGADRGTAPKRAPKRAAERGRLETAWFAADDLLPFLAMLGALLGRGAGKGYGRCAGCRSRAVARRSRSSAPPGSAAGTSRRPVPRGRPPGPFRPGPRPSRTNW